MIQDLLGRLKLAPALAALLLMPACSGPAPVTQPRPSAPMRVSALPSAPANGPRLPENALRVPLVRQAFPSSCGAAALLAVLYYWSIDAGGEGDLYRALATTPADGTEPAKIVEVAAAHGLQAALRQGLSIDDLRKCLARGDAVILDLQAWRDDPRVPWDRSWEDGHYVVLVAIDGESIFAMDPSVGAGYAYLPILELGERWHDYEDRHGKRIQYLQAGIVIHGARPIGAYPTAPVRME